MRPDSVRDVVVSELSDSVGAVQDLTQSYTVNGVDGSSATVAGAGLQDETDVIDFAEDNFGQADNCIMFEFPPSMEGEVFAQSTSLVNNAGFEDGIDPSTSRRTFGGGSLHAYLFDADDVPGWQTTAPDNLIEVWDSGFGGVDSQGGKYHVEVNANTVAQIYQEVSVVPGMEIEYSIWHRGRAGVDVANVLVGAPGAQTVHQTMTTGNTAWVNYTGTYFVPAGVMTLRIGVEAVSTASPSNSVGNFLDNFEVNAVN